MFKLVSPFKPTGDQPQAIEKLVKNLKAGVKHQVLLGVTGAGKTFVMSNVIARIQKPILLISHNKTLAAQTYQEFKEFFPENAVHYFVSYYDYYQPEAYIPQSDTYIEKDAKINEEIDRLRHAAVQDLLTRKDIIIIASVSCIYNIGSPEDYQKVSLEIKPGQQIKRKDFISHLTSLQYQRNDIDFKPGTFRVRGNIVDIFLVTGKEILRIEFSGDEIDKILISPADLNSSFTELPQEAKVKKRIKSSSPIVHRPSFILYPAHFWITPQEKLNIAIENIKLELREQLKKLKKEGKLLEAQKLEQRTNYDLEMLKETGFCHGIENYSRHLEFRRPGQSPYTLIDYYPNDFLVFIDESHMALPQLRAMAIQDRARKRTLIEYGFRLPSAIDNRPLTYKEFEEKTNQIVYVSATPAEEEKKKALQQAREGKPKYIVEQLIRPTGLLEPSIEIRQIKNQVNDLIAEIKKRTKKGQRILVLTLSKRLAEAVSDYLTENGIKTQWLHSEVKTLERPQILKDLREGKYDVLVGINLLREGLDLPEVALVAILDADKEGFLRSETTLIQTMGRAARHPEGQVILYADKITKSIKAAIEEVSRRRKIQENYNKYHNIIPKPIIKEIREWPFGKKKEIASEFWAIRDIKLLEKEMKMAAKNFDFERAAEIRDLIKNIKSGRN
jgi:excinuclease ABC subunit B